MNQKQWTLNQWDMAWRDGIQKVWDSDVEKMTEIACEARYPGLWSARADSRLPPVCTCRGSIRSAICHFHGNAAAARADQRCKCPECGQDVGSGTPGCQMCSADQRQNPLLDVILEDLEENDVDPAEIFPDDQRLAGNECCGSENGTVTDFGEEFCADCGTPVERQQRENE